MQFNVFYSNSKISNIPTSLRIRGFTLSGVRKSKIGKDRWHRKTNSTARKRDIPRENGAEYRFYSLNIGLFGYFPNVALLSLLLCFLCYAPVLLARRVFFSNHLRKCAFMYVCPSGDRLRYRSGRNYCGSTIVVSLSRVIETERKWENLWNRTGLDLWRRCRHWWTWRWWWWFQFITVWNIAG